MSQPFAAFRTNSCVGRALSSPTSPSCRRMGTTTIELLVAFTLLTTAMSVSLQLVVRHGRILESARQYRLAIEELTNQLDRLTALSVSEVRESLPHLKPSEFTSGRLPGAELQGLLADADMGLRLTLSIVWDEPQRRSSPVQLAAWLFPDADEAKRVAPPGGAP
jgi:hypothetical protein